MSCLGQFTTLKLYFYKQQNFLNTYYFYFLFKNLLLGSKIKKNDILPVYMKNIKRFVLCISLICFLSNSFSQDGSTSLHLGTSIPTNEFGAKDKGGAFVGLNFGLVYLSPISKSNFDILFGVDFVYNALKPSVKDELKDYINSFGSSSAYLKYYKYINTPLFAGLNGAFKTGDRLSFYVNAAFVLDYFITTKSEYIINGRSTTTGIKYSPAIGYRLSGGIIIDERTFISIDYFNLKETKEVENNYLADSKKNIDFVSLTVGFKL